MTQTLTIDMTPSPEALGQTIGMFTESIMKDVKQPRKEASEALMAQVIRLTAYLAHTQRFDLIEPTLRELEADGFRPIITNTS